MKIICASFLICATLFAQAPLRYRMDAVAGSSATGDGGPATSALVGFPLGVLADSKGGFYFAQQVPSQIRYAGADGSIRVVVGTGEAGLTPDGVPALENNVTTVYGMALAANGELYFSDLTNCTVSRVDQQGIVRRVAGTSRNCGFGGDGGPAQRALLNDPVGIAFDAQGRLLIADQSNGRIRRINASGSIETIAGTGNTQTFAQEGLAPLQTPISFPTSVAAAADGTIYFSEFGYRRVRRITPAGLVNTVAGDGNPGNTGDGGAATAARLRGVMGVALDAPRNRLFIVDRESHRVRVVNLTSGVISNAAGSPSTVQVAGAFIGDGGPPNAAALSSPNGISVDGAGNLFIADTDNGRIRRADTVIRTVAGRARDTSNGPAAGAEMVPGYLAFAPPGDLIISDEANGILRRVTANGAISTIAGRTLEQGGARASIGDNGPPLAANFESVTGLAVDRSGRVVLTDGGRIRRIDGSRITVLQGPSFQGLAIDNRRDLMYTVSGSRIMVANISDAPVFREFAGGTTAGFSGDGGQALQARLSSPAGLTVDNNGNLYFIDAGTRVRRIDTSNVITTIIGNGTAATAENAIPEGPALETPINAFGLAVDAQGRVTLAEGRIPMIRQYDPATRRLRRIAGGEPRALAGTGSGAGSIAGDPAGNIYFAGVDNVVRVLRPIPQPTKLELVSGNGQSGAVNTALATALVVRVSSADGPAGGIAVTFSANGATVRPASAVTDAEGLARAEVTLGAAAGPVSIVAEVEGLPSVRFEATATAGAFNRMKIISGDGQSLGAGAAGEPLVVEITGADGKPVSGVEVTFSVMNGSVEPAVVLTDESGRASTLVTAGTEAGPVTVVASAPGIESQTFQLMAVAP